MGQTTIHRHAIIHIHGHTQKKNTEAYTITIDILAETMFRYMIYVVSQKTTVTHKETQPHADTVAHRNSSCINRGTHTYTITVRDNIYTHIHS